MQSKMFLSLLVLLALSIRTAGYYMSVTAECTASSSDLSDVELIYTHYCNKDLYMQFNSSVGRFVGFSEFGVNMAEIWNNSSLLQELQAELDGYCKPNIQEDSFDALDKTVLPKIHLRSEQEAVAGHPAMLMCSAYNFYPPAIDVYWLRDGKKVTTESVFIEEMADGDWYYQIHSHLEYTPTSGEKISCVVEHTSSKEPIIIDWDPSLPDYEKIKIGIGAFGLLLGFVQAAVGFIYYKRSSSGSWVLL
ncbi:rano class II histocompatibility antigen, A beta chain-like isoform X2 [Colossoma macropomum]|uniref:rano class II histocompatibility antigen, A beta chain-like isoform X2 n=1 Tax=Colossoma macropomum TaxID=42526 RepID=UPI0018641612|nr:rano class II histocompatibility antigen, A beta chain-like isoform X2 [Colossoma macropomum]